jgi:hypothetical protein
MLGFVLVVVTVLARTPPASGADLLVPVTCFVASVGPACLLANVVSMSVPAIRRANEQAFSGLPTASVQLANKSLWRMSAVLIPFSLVFALLGLFWPWQS